MSIANANRDAYDIRLASVYRRIFTPQTQRTTSDTACVAKPHTLRNCSVITNRWVPVCAGTAGSRVRVFIDDGMFLVCRVWNTPMRARRVNHVGSACAACCASCDVHDTLTPTLSRWERGPVKRSRLCALARRVCRVVVTAIFIVLKMDFRRGFCLAK